MATSRPRSEPILQHLMGALLRQRELAPRALLIAQQISEVLSGASVVLYVVEDQESPAWVPKAAVGEITVEAPQFEIGEGTLGALAAQRVPLLFSGAELAREDYAHIGNVRRTLVSLACIPIFFDDTLVGAVEGLSFGAPITQQMLRSAVDVLDVAGPAISSAVAYEAERNSQLGSISRLAQLYDLEKVFNSNLEMDSLVPTITAKFREVLNVQAVNLWMVQSDDELLLMNQAGTDATVRVDMVQRTGEGIAAAVSDSGEPLLIDDPEDPRLAARNQGADQENAVLSIIAAPLVAVENQVAVVEAVNKLDGTPFDEDELFFLTSIGETAAGALHNASLLQAERKVEILETLVQVSTEITSTLNLERVLEAVVNRPSAVIPYERAAIALEQRGKLQLKAVSGMSQINPGDTEVARLKQLLEWACISNDELLVSQRGEEIDSDREETRAKFQKYFSETGMRGFYALPLADDDGRLGILSLESSDPDFLTPVHLEMLKVLASQATVALRNAALYRDVPLIGVLEPLLQRKRKFLAIEKQRRATFLAAAAAVVAFLAFFPIPVRVDGPATVQAAHMAEVQPEVEGVVRAVYAREGDHIQRGAVLADLEDWNYRDALAAAQAKYDTALSEANRALASNDGTEAGIQRVQANYWAAEVDRAKQRLEKTHLRSPIDGWITTPHVEDLAGRRLSAGDKFAEVVDDSRASVDVAVDEAQLALLRQGANGSVKLDGFPTHTFKGTVAVVSPMSQAEGSERVFYARLSVPNSDHRLRPGMQGRAKVSAGWHPVGYALFRRPALWLTAKLWSWFGW